LAEAETDEGRWMSDFAGTVAEKALQSTTGNRVD
jgi:hypothetical protein